MLELFDEAVIETASSAVFTRSGGRGPPLLLLHGFPETHLMWRDIAPLLATRFRVVLADLRGYGQSGCPASSDDHAPYSKRAMATELVEVMARFGHGKFMVAGHDRGGRVAYRMALDHPHSVQSLAVLDIIPTVDAWERADSRLALGFWPWSLLAQPAPLPERFLTAAADAIIDDAASQWGSGEAAFPDAIRRAYVEALSRHGHAHAICEEYRAAAAIDRQHDEADRVDGRRIKARILALWSEKGGLNQWYEADGGPLTIWRLWCDHVEGRPVAGGHFFPEENPQATASALIDFFQSTASD